MRFQIAHIHIHSLTRYSRLFLSLCLLRFSCSALPSSDFLDYYTFHHKVVTKNERTNFPEACRNGIRTDIHTRKRGRTRDLPPFPSLFSRLKEQNSQFSCEGDKSFKIVIGRFLKAAVLLLFSLSLFLARSCTTAWEGVKNSLSKKKERKGSEVPFPLSFAKWRRFEFAFSSRIFLYRLVSRLDGSVCV